MWEESSFCFFLLLSLSLLCSDFAIETFWQKELADTVRDFSALFLFCLSIAEYSNSCLLNEGRKKEKKGNYSLLPLQLLLFKHALLLFKQCLNDMIFKSCKTVENYKINRLTTLSMADRSHILYILKQMTKENVTSVICFSRAEFPDTPSVSFSPLPLKAAKRRL